MPPPAQTVTMTPRSMPVRGGCTTPRRTARWSSRSSTSRSDQKSAAGAWSRKRRTMSGKLERTMVPVSERVESRLAGVVRRRHAGAPRSPLIEEAREDEADGDRERRQQHVRERIEGEQIGEAVAAQQIGHRLVADAQIEHVHQRQEDAGLVGERQQHRAEDADPPALAPAEHAEDEEARAAPDQAVDREGRD